MVRARADWNCHVGNQLESSISIPKIHFSLNSSSKVCEVHGDHLWACSGAGDGRALQVAPVSALRTETFHRWKGLHRAPQGDPFVCQWRCSQGNKPREPGCPCAVQEVCHGQEVLLEGRNTFIFQSKVKPLENKEQLCSLQRKEWFSSAPKSTTGFFRIPVCPQKQITRLVFNPKSSFGSIWMHQARGLHNRRVSLRTLSPAPAAVSGT